MTKKTELYYTLNQKKRKEIRDKISSMLIYMCDSEIKDQWGCCDAYADIIISEVINPLIAEIINKDKG